MPNRPGCPFYWRAEAAIPTACGDDGARPREHRSAKSDLRSWWFPDSRRASRHPSREKYRTLRDFTPRHIDGRTAAWEPDSPWYKRHPLTNREIEMMGTITTKDGVTLFFKEDRK